MAVYVGPSLYPLGRMIMCHMAANSMAELHGMADVIEVDRRHFQDGPRPHYDISKSKRIRAVELGAIEVSEKAIIKVTKRLAAAQEEQEDD